MGYKLEAPALRRISLFCVIIQSIGIRFFSGFGYLMVFVILIINFQNFCKVKLSHPKIFCAIVFSLVGVCLIKGFSLSSIIYILATIVGSITVLLNYNSKRADFIEDVYPVLWGLSIYGLISWLLLLLIPGIFKTVELGLKYSTFLFILFNRVAQEGSLPRLSSLLWEPGCAQFIFNFLLIILVTKREKISKIILVGLLVLATRSTTGYINLILAILLYAKVNKLSIFKMLLMGGIVLGMGLYSIISDNISDKVENSSGIIRARDLYVGYELSKRHPIVGVDSSMLDTNREAQALEDEIWGNTSVWTSTQGYFAGGYTNGLLGVFLDYGVILGLLLYGFTLKAPIIWNNRRQINPYCFFAVYFCSLIGEPISRTSLFFVFALSYLVNSPKRSTISNNGIIERPKSCIAS